MALTRSEKRKLYMQSQKDRGLCVQCSEPAVVDRVQCLKCSEKNKARKDAKAASGLCRNCGVLTEGRRTYCSLCRRKSARWYEDRASSGVCYTCPAPAEQGARQCKTCLQRKNGYAAKRRDEHKAQGLCINCPSPAEDGLVFCGRCREKHDCKKKRNKYGISKADYLALLYRQGGVCAICGGSCKSGKNLAVDHITLPDGKPFVRGLLCGRCNTSIGSSVEEIERLRKAIDYLERAHAAAQAVTK